LGGNPDFIFPSAVLGLRAPETPLSTGALPVRGFLITGLGALGFSAEGAGGVETVGAGDFGLVGIVGLEGFKGAEGFDRAEGFGGTGVL
jgi:hypothetical protein